MAIQSDNRSLKNKDEGVITREDLSLFMETYKNMIESNLQLMDKQDTTITLLNSLVDCVRVIGEKITKEFQSTEKSHNGFAVKLFGVIGVLCTIILGLVGILVSK
jgi:hypothetical protein